MARPTSLLLVLFLLAPAAPALAWGERGHVLVNEAAARALPEEGLLTRADAEALRLAYLGPEPDRWRSSELEALSKAAAPDHYIDLEIAKGVDPAAPPPHRYAYAETVRSHGEAPEKVGFGPYRAVELCQRIEAGVAALALIEGSDARAEAARAQARAALVYTAGLLGHYVADLSNPHHTTIQYNGWTGPNPEGFATDRGVHARFESDFVERVGDELRVVVRAPARRDLDYTRAIWEHVVESNRLVPALYRLDKEGAFTEGNERTDAGRRGVAFARERMERGATLLRDLWVSALARGELRAEAELLRRTIDRALEEGGFDLWVRVGLDGSVSVEGRLSEQAAVHRVKALVAAIPGVDPGRLRTRLLVLY